MTLRLEILMIKKPIGMAEENNGKTKAKLTFSDDTHRNKEKLTKDG